MSTFHNLHLRILGERPNPIISSKGILGFFSKSNEENLLREMENLLSGTTYGPAFSQYFIRPYANLVSEKNFRLYEMDTVAMSHSPVRGMNTLNGHHIAEWLKVLLPVGWSQGERWKLVRALVFLMGLKKDNNWRHLEELFGNLTLEQQKEVLLLLLMGQSKTVKVDTSFTLLEFVILKFPVLYEAIEPELPWLLQFIEKESGQAFDGHLDASVTKYIQLVLKLKHLSTQSTHSQFYNFDMMELPEAKQFLALPNEESIAFYKFLLVHSGHTVIGYNFQNKIDALQKLVLEKIQWDEAQLIRLLAFMPQVKSWHQLPEKAASDLMQLVENQPVSQPLFEALWDFYFTFRNYGRHLEGILKILQMAARQRLSISEREISWEALLTSGFHPVAPEYTYRGEGLSPAQLKPYFQCLKSVMEVEVVKFYVVNKVNRVRFIVGENRYDLELRGSDCGTFRLDLNKILIENGQPWQFFLLKPTFFSNAQGLPEFNPQSLVVALVNERMFDVLNHELKHQNFHYFVQTTTHSFHSTRPQPPHPDILAGLEAKRSDKKLKPFFAHVNELPQLRTRPDLDDIGLETNRKFESLRGQLEKLQPAGPWMALLNHAMQYPNDGRPSKTWETTAEKLVADLGPDNFRPGLVLLLDHLIKGDEWFNDGEKLCGLRGLTYLCRLHTDQNLLYVLQKMANKAYKKITGGPINAKLGNIALEGLTKAGSLQAFGLLGNMLAKAKYSVYQRALKSSMKKFTKLLKEYSPEELQDRVVPDHGISDGKTVIEIGDHQAIIELEGLKTNILWQNEAGKTTKSPPAELRRDFAGEVQAVKSAAKAIEETLLAQSHRLENSWTEMRSWKWEDWTVFYAGHPLLGRLVERLIWQAGAGEAVVNFTKIKNGYVDSQGIGVEIPEGATVRLWHPALDSVEGVLAWRNFFFDKQITQPFKQAFREVYLLTPAEETTFDHSNRFAGHYLRGNTLYSLGKNRGWVMSYEEPPLRKLPGMTAELGVMGGVLYSNPTTQQLWFKKTDPAVKGYERYGQPKMPFAEVPPVILSEVMRDVDLFVAVSSTGVDPYFDQNTTGDAMNYWRAVSFGEKSKTPIAEIRKDLLQRLLPMTKIAKKTKIEDNWLHVEGKLRNYKINLGSGNILMSPNDQYLCIVPSRDTSLEKKIWLPFEGGDQTLMVILSKAFLLAEDNKITDASITRQIG